MANDITFTVATDILSAVYVENPEQGKLFWGGICQNTTGWL